jgi:hypothetical protein
MVFFILFFIKSQFHMKSDLFFICMMFVMSHHLMSLNIYASIIQSNLFASFFFILFFAHDIFHTSAVTHGVVVVMSERARTLYENIKKCYVEKNVNKYLNEREWKNWFKLIIRNKAFYSTRWTRKTAVTLHTRHKRYIDIERYNDGFHVLKIEWKNPCWLAFTLLNDDWHFLVKYWVWQKLEQEFLITSKIKHNSLSS